MGEFAKYYTDAMRSRDIVKVMLGHSKKPFVEQYRDLNGNTVDFVVTTPNQSHLGIEVKAHSRGKVSPSSLQKIYKLSEPNIMRVPNNLGFPMILVIVDMRTDSAYYSWLYEYHIGHIELTRSRPQEFRTLTERDLDPLLAGVDEWVSSIRRQAF